jgi:hypothetical protein
LLAICDLLRPGDRLFKTATLAMLASMPVYYKTFSLVRGEPFLAFFGVLATYLSIQVFVNNRRTKLFVVGFGVTMALLILSRQFGFLILTGITAFVALVCLLEPQKARSSIQVLSICFVLAGFIAGWFYLHLRTEYGSVMTFSRKPQNELSFRNNPPSFYFGLGLENLFVNPVRPEFDNRLIPVFYSEFWGDYWGYFLIYGRDKRTGQSIQGRKLSSLVGQQPLPEWLESNRSQIAGYLGRVNAFGLIPTFIILAGLALATRSAWLLLSTRSSSMPNAAWTLILLLQGFTIVGYFWFLLNYDHGPVGDTIKATYLLQIYPLMALGAANFLCCWSSRSLLFFQAACLMVVLALCHNLPAMFTHCSQSQTWQRATALKQTQ